MFWIIIEEINFLGFLYLAERDRLKPVPPLPNNISNNINNNINNNQYQHLILAPEVYNHLRGLQKKTKDLKSEVKTLRRLAQSQAIAVREDIKDTFMRIRATLLATNGTHWGQNDQERVKIKEKFRMFKAWLPSFLPIIYRLEFHARRKFTSKKSSVSRKTWQIWRVQ